MLSIIYIIYGNAADSLGLARRCHKRIASRLEDRSRIESGRRDARVGIARSRLDRGTSARPGAPRRAHIRRCRRHAKGNRPGGSRAESEVVLAAPSNRMGSEEELLGQAVRWRSRYGDSSWAAEPQGRRTTLDALASIPSRVDAPAKIMLRILTSESRRSGRPRTVAPPHARTILDIRSQSHSPRSPRHEALGNDERNPRGAIRGIQRVPLFVCA